MEEATPGVCLLTASLLEGKRKPRRGTEQPSVLRASSGPVYLRAVAPCLSLPGATQSNSSSGQEGGTQEPDGPSVGQRCDSGRLRKCPFLSMTATEKQPRNGNKQQLTFGFTIRGSDREHEGRSPGDSMSC